jgi:hypothetical protein
VDISVAANAARVIERHGHRPVSGDRRQLPSSQAMTNIVDIGFEPSGLRADHSSGAELAYTDMFALIRANQRSEQTLVREEKERKLRPGMALATGGLILSKTTTQKVVTHTDVREQVLYVFTRSGAPPWLLREHGARYAGLGADLAPSSLVNFETAVRKLRERAPGATYDARLMNARSIRGIADGAAATDLLANLIVLGLRAPPAP